MQTDVIGYRGAALARAAPFLKNRDCAQKNTPYNGFFYKISRSQKVYKLKDGNHRNLLTNDGKYGILSKVQES